nr:class I SAM-dependent DNA methyltransferase [Nocardia bovistercoris]
MRTRIDRLWDAFWSGGISNPLEAVEQITYLMFLRRLDDLQSTAPEFEHLRWSRLPKSDPAALFALVRDEVFPWLRALGGADSSYAEHMRSARFTIPTPALLAKAVNLLDRMTYDDGDTTGDLYEYMLSKIATAGQNGQFRTPRHIIDLMVAMLAPGRHDRICDPACGTAGFLVAAAKYVRAHHDAGPDRCHGFDIDATMLRIAGMNLLAHEVDRPEIRYRDALTEGIDAGAYSMILANPPFAGAIDAETIAPDLSAAVPTRKSELLFLAQILRALEVGGRAAVIVPEGVLFGSTRAHRTLRRTLVEQHGLDAVVKLPSGVFKPYAGVSTAILVFTKGDVTEQVWFYDVRADGYSLDDRRRPLRTDPPTRAEYASNGGRVPRAGVTACDDVGAESGITAADVDDVGRRPASETTNTPSRTSEAAHTADNIPDVLRRWADRAGGERDRTRADQSFCVPVAEIMARDFDLSLHRYREIRSAPAEFRDSRTIVAEIERLETQIQRGIDELKELLW